METGKQIGTLILTAVALIVGVILLTASSQQVGDVTNTVTLENVSLGAAVSNGVAQYIDDCRLISGVVVYNETNDVTVPADNYTITNNVVDGNGNLAISVTPTVVAHTEKGIWMIDATTCQPTTYDDSSGGRAIAGIIIIMFAIALAIIALYPTLKEAGYMGFR
jgi:hypothetical protein